MFLRVLTIISLILILLSIVTNYLLIKYSIIETMATNGTTEEPKTIYEFVAKDIDGNDVKLDKYKGFPLIVVNVASNCGFTKTNYKELNEIYDKYEEKGLKILAFPCNQFLGQEPGCDVDIKEFAKKNNARYDFFSKIEVNGDHAHPLFKWLKQKQSGFMGSFIKWNFTKFLINREGVPVKRFGPSTSPSKMETDIIAIL
jgi:phospholipid-hydroperoxide glutathione peroxidase